MKYCKKCQVNVNHNHNNCPLCGSYLNPANDNQQCAVYTDIDGKINTPTIKINTTINFLKSKLYKIMIVVCILTIVLNLMFASDIPWSAYIVMGTILLIFSIIFPIVEKTKIQRQICNNLWILTIVAVFFELTVTRLHFEWYVVNKVLPWIYTASIVIIDILILFRRYEDKGLFASLAVATLFAITPQLIYWIKMATGIVTQYNTLLVAIFFAALLNITVVYIVCTRSMKEEVQRNLNL